MKTFNVEVEIKAPSYEDADKARDELVGGLEDARDSGELADGVEFMTGELKEEPFDEETAAAIRDLARDRHCTGSDDEIEVDENAKFSESDQGVWVQAWAWVPISVLKEAGINLEPNEGEKGD